MSDDAQAHLLGRIAVHLKLITMDQLAEATRIQGAESGLPIGEVMVQKGWITEDQLRILIQHQKDYIAKRQAAGKPVGAPPAGATGGTQPVAVQARPATAPVRAATPGSVPAPVRAASAAAPVSPAAATPARPATAMPARPAAAAPRAAAAAPRSVSALEKHLARAVELRGSDLHVHSGAPIKIRINGEFVDQEGGPLSAGQAEAMLVGCMLPEQQEAFDKNGEIDFAYAIAGVGRFRVNLYRQQRGMDGVFRIIPLVPPTLEDLGLPSSLAKVVNYHQGMVLLTGPSGCGKSSTMAALIGILNEERRDHILTIEDPIEHLHTSKRCVVNQRQVSRHTESFSRALRAALREDPDIIVIGELRDRETVSLALTAAETGHLVLGTLHTHSAMRTINRLLGVFPPNQQSQIRAMMSESLKAIVSQRLVRAADGKRRHAALEILICNRAVGNLIRESKTTQILSILQTGAPHGMCLMEASLQALVKSGAITRDEALRHCEDPKRLAA
jgi:twitching motility protein PilT